MIRLETFLVLCLLYPLSLFSQQIDERNRVKDDNVTLENIKSGKNANNSVNFDLLLKTAGGGLFNYLSYQVTSPIATASLHANLEFNLNKDYSLELIYKAEGQKSFEAVPGTTYTLDQLRQYADLRFGYARDLLKLDAHMKYSWMLRPSWPDLYQPNPLSPGGATDPAFGSYLPTDRNSYHKLEPEIAAVYKGIKDLPLSLVINFTRNLEYQDPNYVQTLPIHLTPTTYTGFSGEIGASYKVSKVLGIELKNATAFRTFDFELARDATTGKTHYATTPNPLYKDLENKTTLEFNFALANLKMKIKPFASLDIATDLYKGYYSYTGIEPGIEIEQKIGNFRYALKFSEEMQFFGPNSFDPAATTDGKALYKYYTKGGVNLKYSFNKHFESFIDGEMLLKQTNYPPYVPGVNPGTKNYNINFSFNNFMVNAGVSYKL